MSNSVFLGSGRTRAFSLASRFREAQSPPVPRPLKAVLRKVQDSAITSCCLAALIRTMARTIRWEIEDPTGLISQQNSPPSIWLFWHNRMLLVPCLYRQSFPTYPAKILTSPSADGEVIARVMARFNLGAIRGSTNKRPALAMREMVRALRTGYNLGITPDGPRGPRYVLQPGPVKLAQLSGCPIQPLHINYRKAKRLSGWDAFLLPLPFTSAKVIFGEPIHVPTTMTEAEFEGERRRIQDILVQHTDP